MKIVEACAKQIKGIGELTIYDTALRIGFYLDIYPDKVYLHAGTREGAKRLIGEDKVKNKKYLEMSELPKRTSNTGTL